LLYAAGAATSLVLLWLCIPRMEAAVFEQSLRHASKSPIDSRNVSQVTRVLTSAKVAGIRVPLEAIQNTGNKFVYAVKDNPGAWTAALALANYRSFLNVFSSSIPNFHADASIPAEFPYKYTVATPEGYSSPRFSTDVKATGNSTAQLDVIGVDQNASTPFGPKFLYADGGPSYSIRHT
jgi:hypothetical protein